METWTTLLVIVLALAFGILLAPWVRSHRGGALFGHTGPRADSTPEKAAKREKNGGKNEMLTLISALGSLARKRGWAVVAPAALEWQGSTDQLLALVLTETRVIGIKCFGYGGVISGQNAAEPFLQVLNGERKELPNPVAACETARALFRAAMDANGLAGRVLEVWPVYTNPRATLQIPRSLGCRTADQLLQELKALPAAPTAPACAPAELAAQFDRFLAHPQKQTAAAK